jgi:hypothetical protein
MRRVKHRQRRRTNPYVGFRQCIINVASALCQQEEIFKINLEFLV